MIARRLAVVFIGAALLSLGGCSTHEARFENEGPPRPITASELQTPSQKLIGRGGASLLSLSPIALAAQTEAAAAHYRATQSPIALTVLGMLAKGLLAAQVSPAGSAGFWTGRDPSKTDIANSLRAGLALLSAYEATHDQRYATAARNLAAIVPTSKFGWRASTEQAVVDVRKGGPVAETALAAAFLAESARVLKTDTTTDANRLMRAVLVAQVAVGRWYQTVRGKAPMRTDQWGTTLAAIERSRHVEAQGVLGAGIPAINASTFNAKSRPINDASSSDADGLGQALIANAGYSDASVSGPVLRAAINHQRPNGTLEYADAANLDAQALFAQAIATAYLRVSR